MKNENKNKINIRCRTVICDDSITYGAKAHNISTNCLQYQKYF